MLSVSHSDLSTDTASVAVTEKQKVVLWVAHFPIVEALGLPALQLALTLRTHAKCYNIGKGILSTVMGHFLSACLFVSVRVLAFLYGQCWVPCQYLYIKLYKQQSHYVKCIFALWFACLLWRLFYLIWQCYIYYEITQINFVTSTSSKGQEHHPYIIPHSYMGGFKTLGICTCCSWRCYSSFGDQVEGLLVVESLDGTNFLWGDDMEMM